jgi:predicted aconitase
MATITVDETLTSQLAHIARVTEIRDSDGQVLGYYAPAAVADQVPVFKLAAMFDPDELKRRKASNHPGYTLEQVMEHLSNLEKKP